MIDIRQSPQFANFMHNLGWIAEKIGDNFVYLRKFPLMGYFAKIPRIKPPFPFSEINTLITTKKIFRLKISPFIEITDKKYQLYKKQFLRNGFIIEQFPFNPSTDFCIDLTRDKEIIFQSFTSAKRRAVRRAIKNGIMIKESKDIDTFIRIRKTQYFPLGFLLKKEMQKLWQNFYPKNAALLLAYTKSKEPLSGILLLFYDNVAYYWYASSLKKGKKLFAPTLLVWEALKLSQKRGCKNLVFEGVYDTRFPQASKSWRGFTKFKEGFGGKKIVYMENFSL